MSDLKNMLKGRLKQSAHDVLIQENVTVNSNENVNVNINQNINAYKAKKKFEELHCRQTFYLEHGVLELLNSVAGNEKGLKTRIINDALKEYLKQINPS